MDAGGHLKVTNANERTMGPNLQAVIAAMKSPKFVSFLEQLTGIPALGVHCMQPHAGPHVHQQRAKFGRLSDQVTSEPGRLRFYSHMGILAILL